jgi:NAD(P)-dependent dehydrogenase (short-subunit alcohol dehydrogenase family)
MYKKVLITCATDGIGLETAKALATQGHSVLLHGRNQVKLDEAQKVVANLSKAGSVETYLADLSNLAEVEKLAQKVSHKHMQIDVLINNAGVFKTANPVSQDGLDVRFVVNTVAPYLLTRSLLSLLDSSGRVVNLSSAAQSPVDLKAMQGDSKLEDMQAYAQSKLAIVMWSNHLAVELKERGPVVVSINPGSLLATKMVKEGFGMAGHDICIGSDILVRASLSTEFAAAAGLYFDNDAKQFSHPHPDALDVQKNAEVVEVVESIIDKNRRV